MICEDVCCCALETFPEDGEDALTALTHPHITDPHVIDILAFTLGIGVDSDFAYHLFDKGDEELAELKKYLRDPERAGIHFVDGIRYATLSLRIGKVVSPSVAL